MNDRQCAAVESGIKALEKLGWTDPAGTLRALLSASKPSVPETQANALSSDDAALIERLQLLASGDGVLIKSEFAFTTIGRAIQRLAASPAAPAQSEPVDCHEVDHGTHIEMIPHIGEPSGSVDPNTALDWLETELMAVSCRYHGDPSYDHDAYWMRDRAVKLIEDARKAFRTPPAQTERALTDEQREAIATALSLIGLSGDPRVRNVHKTLRPLTAAQPASGAGE